MIYLGMLISIIFLVFHLKMDTGGDGLLYASKPEMGALPLGLFPIPLLGWSLALSYMMFSYKSFLVSSSDLFPPAFVNQLI